MGLFCQTLQGFLRPRKAIEKVKPATVKDLRVKRMIYNMYQKRLFAPVLGTFNFIKR
jgi:hypothetical protein